MINTPNPDQVLGPVVYRADAALGDLVSPKDTDHRWRFEMIYGGGVWKGHADTPEQLVEALIPGYASITQPAVRAQARLELARVAQAHWQAELIDRFSPENCTPEQRDTLLAVPMTAPQIQTWNAPLPLVLITTDYAPIRPEAAPTGNVLWIDPSGDWELLTTLADLGVITLRAEDLPRPRRSDHPQEVDDDGRW